MKDVEKLLKLDPTNTELLSQEQKLLGKSIEETEKKLKTLKTANEQAADSVKNYDAWKEAYEPIKSEIDETKKKITELKSKMAEMEDDGEIDTQEYKNLQTELAESTRKLKDLKKSAQDVNDEFENPISADQYDALQREIIETENDLKNLKKQAEDTENGITASAANMQESVSGIGSSLENISGKLDMSNTMEAFDVLAGAGEKVVDAAGKTVEAFSDIEGATSKVKTYFGLTGESAEQMGQVVKNVFESGVTDSIDEVADSVIYVNNNLKDLDVTQLETITIQAMNLEKVFGSDMSETMRGVNALMVNFGLDAQTAMDYIVKGSQNGLDKTQELGDNLSEYAGKFSQAGYSAQEYFQLLQNGLEGGAYNLDKVNDSINEVTTRLADGTIAEAIGQFSDATKQTFKEWQEGGATQKDVINSIVSDIEGAATQQEALALASVAFGTMGEDANMGVVTSLTTLGDEYDNVAGAAESMADNATTPMQELQSSLNELETALAPIGSKLLNIATEVLPPIAEAVTKLIDGFSNLPGPVQTFIGVLAGVLAVLATLAPVITAIVSIVSTFGGGVLAPIIGIIAGVVAVITIIITVIQNWSSITEALGDVWSSVCDTLKSAWESVKSFFAGIPEWWSGIWDGIVETFSGVWDAIISNPIVQTVVTTIASTFQSLVTGLSEIWNGIVSVAQGAWELIKNVILGPVLMLIDLVTGNFTQLSSDAQSIWNNISNAASTIWNGITTVISTVVSGLVSAVSSLFSGFASAVSSIWNGIKSAISSVVNGIKTTAINGFKAMVSGIKSTVSGVSDAVINGFNSAISFITSLPGKAVGWGRDFVNGLKDGIMAGVNGIVDAVKGVGDKIRSFLHFSRPDEGPLRDYETWMPDMMAGIAKGIYNNIPLIEKAAGAAAKSINYEIMKDSPEKGIDYNSIYRSVRKGASDSNTVLYIGDREFHRVLKDAGVAFV